MSMLPYLSAMVDFLNREDDSEKKVMCYPITRIVLQQEMTAENPEGRPWRTFVVSDDGSRWVELT